MVWRIWGDGAPLLLLHGGHGSWTHWLRTVPCFAASRMVIAPDMPGYGDSDDLPRPHDIERLAEIVAAGLDEILRGAACDLVGFSFGAVIGGLVARRRPERIARFVLVGAGGLGLPAPPRPPLVKWRRLPGREARDEAHRRNLRALMIHDPRAIDDAAVRLQAANAERARVRSVDLIQPGMLARNLRGLPLRLAGIWGERDATALGFLDRRQALLRELDPASPFATVRDAGHWVQYEAADAFNVVLEGMLSPASGESRPPAHAAVREPET